MRCIIIQGPVNESRLTESLGWEYGVIHSTWKGSEHCYKDTDIVIFNDPPSEAGISNWGYQKKSTLMGLYLAKEAGFSRALKWRSDFRVKNAPAFLEMFEEDKINFYAWHDHDGGYLIDYFFEGDIDDLINLFEKAEDHRFPERNLTTSFFNLGLDNKVNFIKDKIGDGSKTDAFWIKNGFWLSQNNINESKGDYLNKLP